MLIAPNARALIRTSIILAALITEAWPARLEPATARDVAPPPTPSGPVAAPQEIFARAQAQLKTERYPPFVAYVTDVQATVRGKHYEEEFRCYLRTSDGAQTTDPRPIASTNKPENPYGFNIPLVNALLRTSTTVPTPFGLPRMSPTYTFGMAPAATPRRRDDARNSRDDEDRYRTLGNVVVTARDYEIALVGREAYAGREFYHLRLAPVGDPHALRLRELWIDAQNFKIWKLRSDGIFADGPATTVPWEVEYRLIDGHLFVETERSAASVDVGGGAFGVGATRYDGITYTFRDFSYPTDVPAQRFLSVEPTQAQQ